MKEYTTEQLRAIERGSWSEDTFLRNTISHARGRGFKVAHFRPAMTTKGPRTAVQGDGAGFPDLVAINRLQRRGLAWELKSKNGKPSAIQLDWLENFKAMGFDCRVCYPADWDSMMQFLES